MESMQTRQARDRRNLDQGALREHDLTCLACRRPAKGQRRVRCAAGLALRDAVGESTAQLQRQVEQDQAPNPNQGELFT